MNDESKKSVSHQIHHIDMGLGNVGREVNKVIDEINNIKHTLDHQKKHTQQNSHSHSPSKTPVKSPFLMLAERASVSQE